MSEELHLDFLHRLLTLCVVYHEAQLDCFIRLIGILVQMHLYFRYTLILLEEGPYAMVFQQADVEVDLDGGLTYD